MASSQPLPLQQRRVTDLDVESYAAYRAKLAAITGPEDPAPRCFREWFLSKYHANPVDLFVSDATAPSR